MLVRAQHVQRSISQAGRRNRCAALFSLMLLASACSISSADDAFADGAGRGARISKPVDGTRRVELRLENGAALELPAGAVQSATEVQLARMADDVAAKLIGQTHPAVRAIGAPHVLTPHGMQFAREIQLTLPITAQPRSRTHLRAVWLEDDRDREWKQLDAVDVRDGVVDILLDHFSVVMLAEVEPGVGPGPAWSGVLVSYQGSRPSDFVTPPHTLMLVNAQSAAPVEPPVTTTNGSDGTFTLRPPDDGEYWVHVAGSGPASSTDSTYDSLTLWAPRSGDSRVRVSAVGTALLAETAGQYTSREADVAVEGAVYRVDASGRRIGTVGCAKIYLDDLSSPATSADQRYILGVLPGTLAQQAHTQRSGKWHFGNLAPGWHTFKVSMDEGRTFIGEKTVFIPFARRDALGAFKFMVVTLGLDVPGADPTPLDCPLDA